MAVLGMTTLQAVNRVLQAVPIRPVAALDTSGSSDATDAERYLDETAQDIQAKWFPDNTDFAKGHTPAGVGVGGTAITGDGVWTAATRTLAKTGAFPAATEAANSEIYIISGGGVKEGYYGITTNADANTITLDHEISIADQTDITAARFGALSITVPGDTLAIRAAKPNEELRLVLNGDVVYNETLHSSRLINDDVIYLDVSRELTFVNCSPQLKQLIVAEARKRFQMFIKQSQFQDAVLTQAVASEDLQTPRHVQIASQEAQPPNTQPIILQQPQAPQGSDQPRR